MTHERPHPGHVLAGITAEAALRAEAGMADAAREAGPQHVRSVAPASGAATEAAPDADSEGGSDVGTEPEGGPDVGTEPDGGSDVGTEPEGGQDTDGRVPATGAAAGTQQDTEPAPGAGSGATRGVVLTVSDRCHRGEREDRSGPLAAELLAEFGVAAEVRVIPDGAASVHAAIREALTGGARVVFTTGGTGVAPRDRTPEGTLDHLDRELPGLAQAIRDQGRGHGAEARVPTAVLSRGLAGTADARDGLPGAVIVNAPGSTGGVRDAVAVLGPLVGHLLDQLDGGDH